MSLVWCAFAFLCGALPFSVWIGRRSLGADIRAYGDGNPGAMNVLRAGGKGASVLAVVLDVLKGTLPVALAPLVGVSGLPLAAVAIAPTLGHAFSPFLGWRGGKAIAVTYGVWAALTLWRGPVAWGVTSLVLLTILDVDGWAVLLGFGAVLAVVVIAGLGPVYGLIWLGHAVIMGYKHRADLARRPHLTLRWRYMIGQ
jgi:glycerol-3-phosphate acyltransferase PlsY